MKRAFALALLVVAGFGLLYTAHAQLVTNEAISVTLTPAYPRPYQTVTVIPRSSTIDLAASTVTISANGQTVTDGSGSEPAYITVGAAGTATTITVRAVTNGQTYTKTVTIRPADVALIVEPTSTAHPFYEGGTLIPGEGRVRLIAIPDLRTSGGAPIPAANLVYTWRNGEQILQSASGIGKSVLSATAPVRYRDSRITVTVSTQDRSVVGEASAFITPGDPLMRVYRNDPLLGPLYDTALPRAITLYETEESFRAVPYFFPERPAITWEVNGVTGDTDQDITVRATGEGGGTALLRALAKVPTGQSANSEHSITFGRTGGFNFFGL